MSTFICMGFVEWASFLGGPILLIACCFFLPQGLVKNFNSGSPNIEPVDNREKEILDQQNSEIQSILSALKLKKINNWEDNAETRNYFYQKIQNAINYAISRHDWYEEQRYRLLRIHITFTSLAFSLAAVILRIYSMNLIQLEKLVLISIALTLAIALFFMLYLFNSELDQDRSYRLISDIRYWYFRYVLGSDVKKNKKSETRLLKSLRKERFQFFEKFIENYNLSKSLREDIEQIYILQFLQKHKSASVNKMRWMLTYSIGIVSLQALLFIVLPNI